MRAGNPRAWRLSEGVCLWVRPHGCPWLQRVVWVYGCVRVLTVVCVCECTRGMLGQRSTVVKKPMELDCLGSNPASAT